MTNQIRMCEVCGHEGIYTGKEFDPHAEIIEGEYYDRILERDNTRYECRDVSACMRRIDANSIKLTVLSQSQIVNMRA